MHLKESVDGVKFIDGSLASSVHSSIMWMAQMITALEFLRFIMLCSHSPLGSFLFNTFCWYQCEALQMPEMIRQKVIQLACKQVKYGFTKSTIWSIIYLCSQIIYSCYCTFPMSKVICTCLSLQRLFL